MKTFLPLFSAPLLLVGLLSAPAARAGDGPAASPAQALMARHADAIVSIRFVLKTRMSFMGQTQDEESNNEVRGVLLTADGLVMTAASHFEGGLAGRMVRVMGSEIDIDTSVSNLKVLFGAEEKEHEAQLVAKDSNLGLAFVKVLDMGEQEPKTLSLEGPVAPAVGQDLLGLTRMGRGFDCAPSVSRVYVSALVERPRKMWAIDGSFDGAGLPVFTTDGHLVGVLSVQEGAEEAQESGGGLMGMGNLASRMAMFVVPVEAVTPLVEMAKQRAAELAEQAAEAPPAPQSAD